MPGARLHLDEALDLTRTGDVWVFRGRSAADRAIQLTTNAPVNHVGMSVVIEDLPPLMWHAELSRSLPDLWSGEHHRGAQLHDLRDAVLAWAHRYGQRAWLRQLEPPVARQMEDAALRTIARLDGTPFPSTVRLAARWVRGRSPAQWWRGRGMPAQAPGWGRGKHRRAAADEARGESDARLETAYCAEVVAVTYEAMGLLMADRHPAAYDPGRFWSGDNLPMTGEFRLGGEIAVDVPTNGP